MELPPFPFMRDLVSAAGDESKFLALSEIFRSLTGGATPWTACDQLAHRIGRPASEAFALLQAANFLYEQSRGWGPAWRDRLREFLQILPIDPSGDQAGRLVRLCEPLAIRESERHREWLRTGMIANAVSFASFLDLRPAFTQEKDSIQELVPVVLLAVNTDDGDTAVFQLTINAIAALRQVVTEIETKVKTLRTHPALSPLLVDSADGQ